jgi:methylenetetrahydrofolate dehydrogenase (NADP+)/methenyltetrahydrofolate cyclohydrolase
MKLLDGKTLAATVKEEVRLKVEALEDAPEGPGRRPTLALIRVGEDPASKVYVKSKQKACELCGIESRNIHLAEDTPEEDLLKLLTELNGDPDVNGILLQLPVPPQIDDDKAINTIDPMKDVDGFHPENLGRLAGGNPRFVACTPLGIRELLVRNGVDTAGKRAVVIGRSIIVGKPMALLLTLKGPGGDATITICHSRTNDIPAHTRDADIVVAAMGKPGFVTADMVKDGAVVVDVGINRVEDPSAKKGYRLVGDVDFEAVAPKTSFITPVPGGVGPMTVAMLMANTYHAFELQAMTPNAVR